MCIDDSLKASLLKVTDRDILLALTTDFSNEVFCLIKNHFVAKHPEMYAATTQQYLEKEGEKAVLYRVVHRLPDEAAVPAIELIKEAYPSVYSQTKRKLERFRKNYNFSNIKVEEIDWNNRESWGRLY